MTGLSLLIAAGWVSIGSTANAEDVESILRTGTELRRQGRDADALIEFQRAARIQDSPRATAQVGLAEQALGLWADAHARLAKAVASQDDPWIVKNRQTLEKALETIEDHLGRVEVWGGPVGARILIDGEEVGFLPSAMTWIAAGEAEMRASAKGFVDAVRTIKVPAGGRLREHVSLRPLDPAPSASPRSSSAAGALRSAGPPGSDEADPEQPQAESTQPSQDTGTPAPRPSVDDEPPGAWRRTAKWIAWTLGVASLATGIYGIVRNRSVVADFDRGCANDTASGTPYATAVGRSDGSCAGLKSDYQVASRIAIAGLIGTAVLGAGGLALWLTEPPEPKVREAWSCLPGLALERRATMICLLHF